MPFTADLPRHTNHSTAIHLSLLAPSPKPHFLSTLLALLRSAIPLSRKVITSRTSVGALATTDFVSPKATLDGAGERDDGSVDGGEVSVVERTGVQLASQLGECVGPLGPTRDDSFESGDCSLDGHFPLDDLDRGPTRLRCTRLLPGSVPTRVGAPLR